MTDADFICGLMRENTDALGFIPSPTIKDRFIPRGHYLIQRNRFGKPVGYLIHGPVHPDGTLYVHQTCISLERRHRHFGQQTINIFLDRAIRNGAKLVRLRCAADLAAVHFWTALHFRQGETSKGGTRRKRSIIHFQLHLDGDHVHPAPKVGFRLASSEPPPEGLAASLESIKRGTVR